MSQWWRDVSFLHWRVDPDAVAPLLPARRPPRRPRRQQLGRPDPVPHGRRRPRPPRAGAAAGHLPRDQRAALLGRRRRTPRRRLPLARGRPAAPSSRPPGPASGCPTGGRGSPVDRRPGVRTRRGPGRSYRSRRRGRSGAGGRIDVEVGRRHRRAEPARPLPHGPLRAAHHGRRPHPLGPEHPRAVAAAAPPGVVRRRHPGGGGRAPGPDRTHAPESVLFSPGVRTVFGLPQRI